MTSPTFSEWLVAELERRDWSQADLARRSGVTTSQISRVISGERGIGEASIVAIAQALKLPPAQVFRAAGLLPAEPKADPLVEEGIHILKQLEGEDKEEALRYLRLRRQVQEERGKYSVRRRKERLAGA